MQSPEIVSRSEWMAAHQALMAKEKAMTRAEDALAAERRRQPWELVEQDYEFEGPAGKVSLSDLFEGRRQLILYHHMLKKDDPAPCSGCGMFTDNVGNLVHLNQRDTTFAIIAKAPIDQIEALYLRFHGRVKLGFGWGTLLTNDFRGLAPGDALAPFSLVCKAVSANGRPTVKLSDNPAKAVGPPDQVERYKRVFGVGVQKAEPVLV